MAIEETERIDTHTHFLPPFWKQYCEETGYSQADGIQELPEWDAENHIRVMKDLRIKKSILSITSPGTHLVPHMARKMARDCNEYAASLMKKHPTKFGFWATLPLPDVVGSLQELDYALDELHADGVVMLTNHEGRYMGDREFDPIFKELNRRKVTVFIHPTTPCMKTPLGPMTACPIDSWPSLIFEFIFEDTRGILNLFLTGMIDKYPDVKYISSHAGGSIFALAERFGIIAGHAGPETHPSLTPAGVRKALREKFFFDLAGFPFKGRMQGLLEYVDASRLLYGSDYPYTPEKNCISSSKSMDKELADLFPDESDYSKVYSGNAETLLRHSSGPSCCGGHGKEKTMHEQEYRDVVDKKKAISFEELGPDMVLLRDVVGPALQKLLRETSPTC
ncbi:MAG: hypothetical protein M1827_004886 [Pycnora praestabilis]|nr:MAG: hypothetical protein M1827_004886 [Pycnora praestabilis]